MPIDPTPLAWMVAAFGAHLVAFWVGRNEGLRGGDEGYLVYGASRTRMGEVPIRDFRAYEPGRYWFVVALSGGRVTIRRTRFACGVFHGGATAVLVMALEHHRVSAIGLAATIAITAGWTYLPYNRIDAGAPLLGVAGVAMALGEAPDSPWWLVAGVAAGGVGVVGVNWGLYATLAGVVAVAVRVAAAAEPVAAVGSISWRFVVGGLIGASPLLVTAAAARGFGPALLERRLFALVRRGSTNLPRPYPWPWRPPRPEFTAWYGRGTRAATVVMLVVPLVCMGAVVAAFVDPPSAEPGTRVVTIAAATMTLMVWHYFASRADLAHLMVSAPLGLVATVLLAEPQSPAVQAAIAVVAVAAGWWTLWIRADWAMRRRTPERFRQPTHRHLPATTRRLHHPRSVADLLDRLAPLAGPDAAHETWLAVPNQLYVLPLVDRSSAVYDLFCVYPAAPGEEDRMLAELDAAPPAVAVVSVRSRDGDPDLRFPVTHPRVFAHIEATMRRRADLDDGLARDLRIYTAERPAIT